MQKLVASSGHSSRRQAEELITAGRVRVDGKLAKLGLRVSLNAKISIDGKQLGLQDKARNIVRQLIAYNKPRGQIVSRSGTDRVFDHLPKLAAGRWVNIGRLDVESEGLLLFTTDGDLANQLAHPSYKQERVYQVKSHFAIDEDKLAKVVDPGLSLDGKRVKVVRFKKLAIKSSSSHWYEIVLTQGRNRVVRKIFAYFRADVLRLVRTSYGKYNLARNHALGTTKKLPFPMNIRFARKG